MNKTLSAAELKSSSVAVTMTKADKLMYWAQLIRDCPTRLRMYSDIEYMHPSELDAMKHSGTVFALAYEDPILRDAGLAGGSIGDGKRFFELTGDELHAFSCDCHGEMSNEVVASRITAIAHGKFVSHHGRIGYSTIELVMVDEVRTRSFVEQMSQGISRVLRRAG
jgi:hypothetical protein